MTRRTNRPPCGSANSATSVCRASPTAPRTSGLRTRLFPFPGGEDFPLPFFLSLSLIVVQPTTMARSQPVAFPPSYWRPPSGRISATHSSGKNLWRVSLSLDGRGRPFPRENRPLSISAWVISPVECGRRLIFSLESPEIKLHLIHG